MERFGPARTRPVRSAVAAAVLALALLGADSFAAAPLEAELRSDLAASLSALDTDADGELPFSLVIKGGISLGAYEAGVNWALLRILRDFADAGGAAPTPRLLAAAGASAGAINGFLAGLMWCSARVGDGTAVDTLEQNLLRDTWRRVGIGELLTPPSEPEDQAAFSRAVLRQVEDAVTREMETRAFRDACAVAFGASLTRSKPVTAANAGVHVPQQRLVLPLIIRTGPDGVAVQNFRLPEPDFATADPARLAARPFLSNVIYLDAGGREAAHVLAADLPIRTVFEAIKASASFPVAFSPLKLDYCLFRPRALREAAARNYPGVGAPTPRCPPNYRRLSSFFVDGGVFDNDPLELVRHLSERHAADQGLDTRGVQYVKIDPDRRRPPAGHFEFMLPPYAEPGDSIELSLWAGDPAQPEAAAETVEGSRIETVRVIRCLAEPLQQDGRRQWLAQEFRELSLVETGVNTRLYIGAIHTRAAADPARPSEAGPVIPVGDGDRLLVYSSREAEPPTCAADAEAATLRHSRQRSIGIVSQVPPGLLTQLGFLGGSISSARNSRLHDELLGSNWHDGLYAEPPAPGSRALFQPARLTPLVGDSLHAFGAFLDERFRDFDYYAGVYDAVYGLAELLCRDETGAGADACRGRQAEAVYLHLCAPGAGEAPGRCRERHPEANAVIRQLVLLENCGYDAAVTALDGGCELAPQWRWAEQLAGGGAGADTGAGRQLVVVGAALLAARRDTSATDGDPFVRFVQELARRQEQLEAADNAVLERMLARSDWHTRTWYYPLSGAVIPRLLDLQHEDSRIRREIGLEPADGAAGVTAGLALGGLLSESLLEQPLGWQWDQTSVPGEVANRWLAALAPSEFAIDARNGGMALFWNPGLRFSEDWALDLRIGPWQSQDFAGETIEFAEATAFATWRSRDPLLSSVGVGPTFTYTWSEQPFGDDRTLGASAFIGLAADKIRVTYGWRSFSRDEFAGDDIYWHLGVNDLPGLLYWGCRGWDEPPDLIAWICGP